ncbi:recombinase family protein [Chromobacterium amazonense]|nr:recombinase family protein [Chromobacterium amazonense]
MALIGYARVSTLEQDTALQTDALREAGCKRIFEDTSSGAKVDRPGLTDAIAYLRDGDVLVVWRLDRLGRSLGHLIEVIRALEEQGVGFRSLTENIDTTTPGGKLIFHLFGALSQFERDLIRERTKAGLAAAAARGRKGGRKPVVTDEKLQRAKDLLTSGLNVREAATRLKIGKTALYDALKQAATPQTAPAPATPAAPIEDIATIHLTLRIQNNNKFVRGKKRAIDKIETWCLAPYEAQRLPNGDYELKLAYKDDADLDDQLYELLGEIASDADDYGCFSESEARMPGTNKSW